MLNVKEIPHKSKLATQCVTNFIIIIYISSLGSSLICSIKIPTFDPTSADIFRISCCNNFSCSIARFILAFSLLKNAPDFGLVPEISENNLLAQVWELLTFLFSSIDSSNLTFWLSYSPTLSEKFFSTGTAPYLPSK